MIGLGRLLVLALRQGPAAREASRVRVLQLLLLYETEFDAMCGWVAAGFPFAALRDRISPLHAACTGLLSPEPEPMRDVLDAHCAVVAQLFALADALASGGDATGPALALGRLRACHAASVQRVRERVQRMGEAGAAER